MSINIFMIENLTNVINEAVKTTEGCQRNWDYDYIIPQEHIDTIVNTAITMPTKQNQEFYSLIVSTDRDFNYNFYLRTFRDDSGLYNDGRNSQTNAPLLLVWIKNPNYKKIENSYEGAGPVNIGVSAGGTALAANLLGYRTGFCACINKKETLSMLKKRLSIHTKDIEVALGIGMPDLTMPDRNYVKLPNGTIKKFQKRIKDIKVYKI
jgi:hypothetical protein